MIYSYGDGFPIKERNRKIFYTSKKSRTKLVSVIYKKNQLYLLKHFSALSEELTHTDYWASRQQLLSGKVVADWIDQDYGPLDPFFGVLLNPTLGLRISYQININFK